MKIVRSRSTWWLGIGMVVALLFFGGVWQANARVPDRTVTCRVEMDRDVVPVAEPQRAVIKITLDPVEPPKQYGRPPVNLSVVLDRSGSMGGEKLRKAKEAAIEALRRLDSRDIFSLIIYDQNVETLVPAQSAGNTQWIESRIRKISSGGQTALFGGVSQAAAEIRKNLSEKNVNRIILLSDGIANVGPSSPSDLGRLGAGLIKEGISVTTVGVGTDYNEDLMARLSQESDGNTYFVEASQDLPKIFAGELGDVLKVVAKKVIVAIECSEDVRPLSIIGREGRIHGQTIELYLNQLYGGQEKYALVEVEVPVGKSGEDKELAVARVSYENPFTQKKESSSGAARIRYSKDMDEVEKSANVDVHRAYSLNLNVVAQEEAIALSDEGKKEEAADRLRGSAAELRVKGKKYDDKVLLREAKEMESQADGIERAGMSKGTRKWFRARSYQLKNQQNSR